MSPMTRVGGIDSQPLGIARASELHERTVSGRAVSGQILARAGGGRLAELKGAATELVSTAFVVPALESLHNSPLRPQSGPFALGMAEKRFAPLLEQRFADSVVKAANLGLVDAITQRLTSDHPR